MTHVPGASKDPQAGVVLGRFEYPLLSEGLVAALGSESTLKLLAVDVEDAALGDVVTRDAPNVAILDERSAGNRALVQAVTTARAQTQLVVLTHPPASAPVLQLIADGATCLSKRAPVAEVVATVLLSAQGHSVVSKDLAGPSSDASHVLTPRERDVLEHLEKGAEDSQIAQALKISIATVRTHNVNIFRKLAVRRRDLIRQQRL
jgi:DNA-binding NarL/FixJ family response regulator